MRSATQLPRKALRPNDGDQRDRRHSERGQADQCQHERLGLGGLTGDEQASRGDWRQGEVRSIAVRRQSE
jgi:hypothetical protein